MAYSYRRPLDTLSSTFPVSYYYDVNTTSASQRYTCETNRVYNNHRGTDFPKSIGTPVLSGATGILYYRVDGCPTTGYWGSTCGGGFGNHVRINHFGAGPDGKSIYAHMKLGTPSTQLYYNLSCGTQIGQTGSSGNSTGPHLHFEVRDEVALHPGQERPAFASDAHEPRRR